MLQVTLSEACAGSILSRLLSFIPRVGVDLPDLLNYKTSTHLLLPSQSWKWDPQLSTLHSQRKDQPHVSL